MLSVFPKISKNLRQKFQEKTIYFLVGLDMYPEAFSAPKQIWHSEDFASWYILKIKGNGVH